MTHKRVSCLIPAAGEGERFRRTRKGLGFKLELPLEGKTLLERTLDPFLKSKSVSEIVIAVSPGKVSSYRKLFRKAGKKKIRVVGGGDNRTESVRRALRACDPEAKWIIVHDGARPLLDGETLERFLKRLFKVKALIMARPVAPTLKRSRANTISETVSRTGLWEAETPQGFEKAILNKAYQKYRRSPFQATDEASLVEADGTKVFLFKNAKPNLKITTFSDYQVAKKVLEGSEAAKAGIGYDIHRLVKGRPFWLSGLRLPFSKGSLGHSDGDAVLHALSDALLGSLALGDIGKLFPDTSSKTRGMKSSIILKKVYDRVTQQGYELVNADINVILERPKLGSLKEKCEERIASIMGVCKKRISLKARTAEGLGPVGRSEAVAAQAIVTVRRND